jgi:hypothetical protein
MGRTAGSPIVVTSWSRRPSEAQAEDSAPAGALSEAGCPRICRQLAGIEMSGVLKY